MNINKLVTRFVILSFHQGVITFESSFALFRQTEVQDCHCKTTGEMSAGNLRNLQ